MDIKCTKCKITKNEDKFRWRNKNKNIRSSWCKECFSLYEKLVYSTREKEKIRKLRNGRRQFDKCRKHVHDILKNSSCKDCGEDNWILLEFDHLPEYDKISEISTMVRHGFSLNKINKEIAKCEIVCPNCHKLRTYKRGNWEWVKEWIK